MNDVYTIGHSTQTIEHFIESVRSHSVTAIADVRSVPLSRFTPQFNREALTRSLRREDIAYVFLGRELGARSTDPANYLDGVVQYDRLAQTPEFQAGLDRLELGRNAERIAIMCAEQEPLECHRTVLVSEELRKRGIPVRHIHSDGTLEPHEDAIHRLMVSFGLDQPDLLHSEEQLAHEALKRQEKRIAYVTPAKASGS